MPRKNITKDDGRPFEPGKSGNPNGRPKGKRNKATVLKELLALAMKSKNPITGKEEPQELEVLINYALIQKALKGDVMAYREISDIIYGKVKDHSEINIVNTPKNMLEFFDTPKDENQ